MKIESSNDVQTIQRLDQPVVRDAPAPAAPKGADELAQLFSQEVVANTRELSRRSMGIQVSPIEQLAQLYDQLGHAAQASIKAISLRLRMQLQQSQPSVDQLIELTGGDPARAFVVLKHVVTQADSEGRPHEAKMARAVLDDLEKGFKGEIQAGLNIAVKLQKDVQDPQERQMMRTLYYGSVVQRQSLTTMMHALLDVYGSERFMTGLNVMRRALADDLASRVSSIPRALLQSLLLGLRSCSQLSGVLSSCQGLVQRLKVGLDSVGLLQRMLGYASTGVDSNEILRLVKDLKHDQPSWELVALNALYPVLQQLPQALWVDEGIRKDTLGLFLAVMHELARTERVQAGLVGGRALA